MTLLEQLTSIRNQLVRVDVASTITVTHEVSRMLDSIAENAVNLRARMEHGDTPRARRLVKRVRRALGYTYP
jgi:hypothetical protein